MHLGHSEFPTPQQLAIFVDASNPMTTLTVCTRPLMKLGATCGRSNRTNSSHRQPSIWTDRSHFDTRANCVHMQRPLRTGEPHRTVKERASFVDRSDRQSVFQLGVHADDVSGVESQGLAGTECSGNRSLEDSPSWREVSSVENGIPNLRDSDNSHPVPDCADESPHDLSPAERQHYAAGVLATGGIAATLEVDRSPSRTAASSLVQWSQDLDVLILSRHRPAPKEIELAINENRANQRRASFVSWKSLRQFSSQTTPAGSLVLGLVLKSAVDVSWERQAFYLHSSVPSQVQRYDLAIVAL